MARRLTSKHFDSRNIRPTRWTVAFAMMLIAIAVPTMACEKSRSVLIAEAQRAHETVATFTGEFVNGAPVYRLPTITVVTRRELEIAGAPRDAVQAHPTRSPASPLPKPRAG